MENVLIKIPCDVDLANWSKELLLLKMAAAREYIAELEAENPDFAGIMLRAGEFSGKLAVRNALVEGLLREANELYWSSCADYDDLIELKTRIDTAIEPKTETEKPNDRRKS